MPLNIGMLCSWITRGLSVPAGPPNGPDKASPESFAANKIERKLQLKVGKTLLENMVLKNTFLENILSGNISTYLLG